MIPDYLPQSILPFLKGRTYSWDEMGLSAAKVLCFEDMVLKVEETSATSENEYRFMRWLEGKLPVPKVIAFARQEGKNYLLMSRIEGEMLCAPTLMERPKELVRLAAEGLRMLWNVDISDCPVQSQLDLKLEKAAHAVKHGLVDVDAVEPDTFGENGFSSPEALLAWLYENRPQEEPVFSHGDFCLPNIFEKNGRISGFIDLGNCGAGDRYQDIALCLRSLRHNYEGRFGGKVYKGFSPEMLLEALGMKPDWKKIRYYTLLDELL